MPTLFTHPAVALAAAPWFRGVGVYRREIVAGATLSALPDLDVVTFVFGIPYGHVLGHRGLSHSLLFAAFMSGLFVWRWFANHPRRGPVWFYLFFCAASHGLLDALTNGGMGVALFAPFDNSRYFFPWRPIEVSPIGRAFFFNHRGEMVIGNELLWIWLPALLIAAAGLAIHIIRKRTHRTH